MSDPKACGCRRSPSIPHRVVVRSLFPFAALLLTLTLASTIPTYASAVDTVQIETIRIMTGDTILVNSDQYAITDVFIRGNLTASNYTQSTIYPIKSFYFSSSEPSFYNITLLLSFPYAYNVAVSIKEALSNTVRNYTSYFISKGEFALILQLSITKQNSNQNGATSAAPSMEGFKNWVTQFGSAFPLWTKILYLVLGIQFLFVGFKSIKFEDARRKSEGRLPTLDRGNKLYLWVGVAYKFLLVGFVITLALMVGEIVLIYVLKFMFLASLDLVSLWDFFVLVFMGGMTLIAYIVRTILERVFDLKPLEEVA